VPARQSSPPPAGNPAAAACCDACGVKGRREVLFVGGICVRAAGVAVPVFYEFGDGHALFCLVSLVLKRRGGEEAAH